MTDHSARTRDDTVELNLADDLLGPADEADVDPAGATPSGSRTAGTTAADPTPGDPTPADPTPADSRSTWPDLPDDEDYLAPAARRGKLTTGLLIALIFLVGVLVGTVLTRTLAPEPAPQIVYVLNDSGSSAPTATASPTR